MLSLTETRDAARCDAVDLLRFAAFYCPVSQSTDSMAKMLKTTQNMHEGGSMMICMGLESMKLAGKEHPMLGSLWASPFAMESQLMSHLLVLSYQSFV